MPPLVTSQAFAERVVAADKVVSRQVRSGEARRGMAIEPFAPKDVRVFGALRDGFRPT
jgi:hypothetical protein